MGRVLHLGPSWHGPSFMWADLAWAELVLGRVVLHPVEYWYFIGVSSHSYIGHCLNVTDNINLRAVPRHNNIFNRYLPTLLYLPSTTPFIC